jgi:hypothetical protein
LDPLYLAMDFNVLHACHGCRLFHLSWFTLGRSSWCLITRGCSVSVGHKAACMRLNVAKAGLGRYMSFNERTCRTNKQRSACYGFRNLVSLAESLEGCWITPCRRGLLYGRLSDETRCLWLKMIRDYSDLHFLVLQNRVMLTKCAKKARFEAQLRRGSVHT